MRKPKSTRETKNMIQTALWLPRDMHERLKKDGGERGMGDEIRRRLEVSMQEPTDERTDVLLDLIRQVAQNLSTDEPLWADPFAFDVFKAAVSELLLRLPRPTADEPQPGSFSKLQTQYGPDVKPELIGRVVARNVLGSNSSKLIQLQLQGPQKA